ncbi:MAG: hypothetical protein ABGW87_07610 [Sphingomonadaceae bacterium]
MPKKVKAPPGLDYDPVRGNLADFSFGIIQAKSADESPRTAEATIGKRLFPISRPTDLSQPWPSPTCHRFDVLLPPGAADEFAEPQQLCRAFDRQSFGDIRDLVVIITIRFPKIDAVTSGARLHEAWELGRSFCAELVHAHQVAIVAVMHVPARAARPGLPHIHLMAPARVLLPSGFGKFAKPLATIDGREIAEKCWSKCLEAQP